MLSKFNRYSFIKASGALITGVGVFSLFDEGFFFFFFLNSSVHYQKKVED
jgi:hypothetical protein